MLCVDVLKEKWSRLCYVDVLKVKWSVKESEVKVKCVKESDEVLARGPHQPCGQPHNLNVMTLCVVGRGRTPFMVWCFSFRYVCYIANCIKESD